MNLPDCDFPAEICLISDILGCVSRVVRSQDAATVAPQWGQRCEQPNNGWIRLKGKPQMTNPKTSDFVLENHFSIYLLRPASDFGRTWIEDHIGETNGFQPYYPTVICEPRYVEDLLRGIADDGLTAVIQ